MPAPYDEQAVLAESEKSQSEVDERKEINPGCGDKTTEGPFAAGPTPMSSFVFPNRQNGDQPQASRREDLAWNTQTLVIPI